MPNEASNTFDDDGCGRQDRLPDVNVQSLLSPSTSPSNSQMQSDLGSASDSLQSSPSTVRSQPEQDIVPVGDYLGIGDCHSVELSHAHDLQPHGMNSPSNSAEVNTEEKALSDNTETTDPASPNTNEEAEDKSPLFTPPLYRQRYSFVRDILVQHDVTSVVDFGCAEPKLLAFLKYCQNIECLSGQIVVI